MKRFEILEDTSYDRYLIYIYSLENGSLIGVNYHHGIGDLDTSYLESDENLLAIYLERMKGRANDDSMIDIMRASIDELQVKSQEYIRNEIVHDEVTRAVGILKERLFKKLYINEAHLSKGLDMMIASMEDDMISTLKQVSNATTKDYK